MPCPGTVVFRTALCANHLGLGTHAGLPQATRLRQAAGLHGSGMSGGIMTDIGLDDVWMCLYMFFRIWMRNQIDFRGESFTRCWVCS